MLGIQIPAFLLPKRHLFLESPAKEDRAPSPDNDGIGEPMVDYTGKREVDHHLSEVVGAPRILVETVFDQYGPLLHELEGVSFLSIRKQCQT